ncbi:reverse transcriptase [Tanacetum coccineum]
MLKNDQGDWVKNSDQLHKLIRDHFNAIYSSSGHRDFDGILDTFAPAVSSSGHKAPGDDGFPRLFFQKYWHIVGESVSKAVMQFFNNGSMLPFLNKTLVVLIPKVPVPEAIGEFRPISLYNFVYRVISKVMANRLKPFMHRIISPQQSAFIPGRLIQDYMIVANEAFHYIRNKKKGDQKVMALKLDLNKAFDRVEWDFLIATCRKLGFGET